MSKLKSKLAIFLAVITLGVTAIAVIPSGDTANMTFEVTNNQATLTKYDGSSTKINVPETYNGYDVTTIVNTAFNDEDIEMIYLPITVTNVGENAFLNCGDNVMVILELFDPLADVPTDVDKWGLGEYTAEIRHFTSTGRTDLFIQKGEVIGCSNIMSGSMFEILQFAESKTGRKYTSTSYTSITFVQENDYEEALPDDAVDISEYQTGCVQLWTEGTDIIVWFMNEELIMHESMYAYFSSYVYDKNESFNTITEINGMEHLNTEKVTDMSHMFNYNLGLLDIDITNFDTSNVSNTSCMFYYCIVLESIDITMMDTSNVIDMSYMFGSSEPL